MQHSARVHHVYIPKCPVNITCRNHQSGMTATACSTLGLQLYFSCSSSCGMMLFISPHAHKTLVRKGRWDDHVLDFFKAVRCVNALIFMYTTASIITDSIARLKQTSAQLSHEPTFLFLIIIFWFYSENRLFFMVLCRLCKEVRDQAGAGRDPVSCSKTLKQTQCLLRALHLDILPFNPQHWQLNIFLAFLFLDCFTKLWLICDFYLQTGN